MNEEKRKPNISLIIGLAIPVAMIVLIAAGIYLPRLFTTVDPARFDYLYVVGPQDPYNLPVVRNGRLVQEQRPIPKHYTPREDDPHFFIHEVGSNKSREITFEKAQELQLDSSAASPDGYTLERGRRGSWFPFDYGYDYSKQYLVKDHYAKEQNLELDRSGYYYYGNFRLLGWIMSAPAPTTEQL